MNIPQEVIDLLPKAIISGVKRKSYDKQIKSYYYDLTTSTSKLQLLKDTRNLYSAVIFQIWIPIAKHFNFELSLSDSNKVRIRVKVR